MLRVRCPWPLRSHSLVCRLGVLCVRCPWPLRSRSSVCPLSVLCFRCPWPLGSPLPVCPLGPLCRVCGVLGHLARLHRCACLLWCAFGVLGHLAPVHRCARLMCCVACAVSLACWLSFTSVHAWCVVMPVPLGSRSPVCALGVLCCVCSVLGDVAPVHRCARLVQRVVCAVSLVTWLAFTGVHARCVVLCVRCSWPLGSCSPVCTLSVLCCVCGVPGHLAPVHWCERSVCCVACAVSLATSLPFIGVPAPCVVRLVSFATWLPFTSVPARPPV